MAKIAIITFHRAINFGAVLQTYALSSYLKNLGFEVDVLDYRSKSLEDSYKTKFAFDLYSIKRYFLKPLTEIKKKKFRKFICKNINLTQPLSTFEELQNIANNYDFIITGSDQVWNKQWTQKDSAYLLDFCNDEQKVSYAASIGKSSLSEEEKVWLSENLKSFRKISVRETTGKKILNEFVNKEISVNCDPVVLLDKEQWTKISKCPKEKGYVLIYMLVASDSLVKAAADYGKNAGKEVIMINDNLRKQYDVKYKRFCSPEDFVGLFKNADCVFTNSFHGTMFSIIFEKEVHIELQKYKDAPNSRFVDLLKNLGMEACIFSEDMLEGINSNSIDYSCVREKIAEMKEQTNLYFDDAFQTK